MDNDKIHSNNCSEVIDLLLSQMEADDFNQNSFDNLVQQHPNCVAELNANYQLWKDLGTIETPAPSTAMSTDFYRKLNDYSAQNKVASTNQNGFWQWLKSWNLSSNPQLGWAMGLGLFLFGFFAGQFFTPNPQQAQIDALAQQVQQLQTNQRKDTRFQVNLQQSVAGRMKDIQLVRQMENPNAKILMALNKALCNDPNINVRLSAVESLVYFSDDPDVMEILIKAIPKQTSPIVQLELAEVMVQLEEKRSSGAWKELLESGDLELNVKMQLEESLEVLL